MLRVRKIFVFTLYDFWFDKEAFIESKKWITILNTSEKIDKKYYSFQISGKTFIINLTNSLEDILNHFDKKSHPSHNIRKAEKDGLKVVRSNSEELTNQFYEFFHVFAQKKKIPIMKIDELKEYDLFHVYSSEGTYLGGCAFLPARDKSVYRYKHVATYHTHNENEFLIWNAIKYAKDCGYLNFDLGGVILTEDQNSYYYNHYKNKKKYGGELTDFHIYIKVRGILILFIWILNQIVKIFFKNDYNGFVNFIHKIKVLQ